MDEKLITIIKIVCEHYQMNYSEFMSNNRSGKNEYVRIRQFIFWFYRVNTNNSLANLGKLFNKDHATALSGINKVMGYRDSNKHFLKDSNELIYKIRSVYPEFNKPILEESETRITLRDAANKLEQAVKHVMDDVGVYRLKIEFEGDLINIFK